jgi:hypothetical protein
MTDIENKPREFWIDFFELPNEGYAYGPGLPDTQYQHMIHVIEMHAYDSLAKKFKEVFGPAGFKSVSQLMDERDKSLAREKALVEALEGYANADSDDEIQPIAIAAIEALEEWRKSGGK